LGSKINRIASCLQQANQRLRAHTETPYLDAQVLLAHILGEPRAWVLAHPEIELSHAQSLALEQSLGQLETGEPLPYVLGHWEFFGLDFELSPATLIPRPETELLVEQALAWLRLHPGPRKAADVGAGSGCIAVSLAVHTPNLVVLATDLSPEALEVAGRNSRRHAVAERVALAQCDLLPKGEVDFDLICANLPYIPTATLRELEVYEKEPTLALDGGEDGLDVIRRLLKLAPVALAPGGLLLVEIEATQGEAARRLAQEALPDAEVRLIQDLAGRDRLVRVERRPTGSDPGRGP